MMFDVLDAENIPVSKGVVNLFYRQQEIAVAASKPEIVMTHERNEISAKFQRLRATYTNIFEHARHNLTGSNIVRCRPTPGNSNGGQ